MTRTVRVVIFLWWVGLSLGHPAFAHESTTQSGPIGQQLALLESRVSSLKVILEQTIQKQSEIKEKLLGLKIWIKRTRS